MKLYLSSDRTMGIVARALVLSTACFFSYDLMTLILHHPDSVSKDDRMLGGMWAVVATVFVYQESTTQSVRAALSRMAATCVSFALCLVYLLFFPFHVWGMALLIGLGAIIVTLIQQPQTGITTGITTAVVMVVAGLSPESAWRQPIFRFVDTLVGVIVGLVAVKVWQFINRSNVQEKASEP
jgi:uncharacterized membrane protein YgaE (UPF0421/DUF939 family)